MSRMAWIPRDRPLVFAHRGGSRLAPENTLAAFDRGVAEGVDGLELDVRLSRDGEVMVCHDARLDRTCDVTGAIADLMASDLAHVDAGFRFTPGDGTHPFRARGLTVPTLRQVLERYPGHSVIVEMKDDTAALARATVEVARDAGALDRICLGSFYKGVLRCARRLAPGTTSSGSRDEVFRAVLASRVGWLPPFRRYQALQVPEQRESIRVVSPAFVRAAHRAGVPVQVWIVDRPDAIRRLLDWGVDAVISDRPDIAVTTVAAWRQERGNRNEP
jgi:glycerophosphoryl diester phosphodiesterase